MGRPSLVPPALNGNVFSCVQEVTFLQQKCQFSHYYQEIGPVSKAAVPAAYNAIQGHWFTVIRPLLQAALSVGTFLDDFRVWCMNWPDVATGVYTMGHVPGTVAGDPLPPQIAGVLTKKTLLRGRSGRGRMYICGMSEDGSTNGAPTNPQLASMNALCGQLKISFLDVGTGLSYQPCVVSLKQYALDSLDPPIPPALVGLPKPPPIPIRGGIISEMLADDIWYTQRRRTIRHGQ